MHYIHSLKNVDVDAEIEGETTAELRALVAVVIVEVEFFDVFVNEVESVE